MDMKTKRGAVVAALLIASGCAQAGSLGDVLGGVLGGGQPVGGTQSGAVTAEVRAVDTRNQIIEIRTDDGQNADIRYDQNTRVVYRQQEYQVSALESGDLVRMDVQRTTGNEYYTRDIEVQQSVQDRRGDTGYSDPNALYQFSGTVDQIDQTRGLFTLRTRNDEVVTVAMPYNASSSARDRFQRLRRGSSVAIEGRYLSQEQVQLTRFL
jgi:hypothetical protein